MEIIVSLTILSLTMAGLLSVFISAKKHSLRSRSRVSAGQLGKYFLDPLQMSVTMLERTAGAQNGWGQVNNCLSSNPTSGCPGAQNVGNMLYTPTYTIDNVTGTGIIGNCLANDCLRRVEVDIQWQTR